MKVDIRNGGNVYVGILHIAKTREELVATDISTS